MDTGPFPECGKKLTEFGERLGPEEAWGEYLFGQWRRNGFPFPEAKDQEAKEIERCKFKEI